MAQPLVKQIYDRLVTKHRVSPVIESRDIINSIGMIGVDYKTVIKEMVELGMLTRSGQHAYRLTVDPKKSGKINEGIKKSKLAKKLLSEISYESHGLSESVFRSNLLQEEGEETPAAPEATPVPANIPTPKSQVKDSLVVTTSYNAASVDEAKSVLSSVKGKLSEKGVTSCEYNLISSNPFEFSIQGAPEEVSMAEFNLSSVLVDVLGNKTDVAKLKIEKERKSSISVQEAKKGVSKKEPLTEAQQKEKTRVLNTEK